ncbi:hypothetical protein [Sphingomonas sp. dw_22]|uniref:hypothetical protein n=1 Tax=Sphingomonas sp. dw_22 TaxID=2721175 RepID=UPI001BD4CDDD|nr:hypothetical protein [Sphingomonas sp. dw_22]
MGELRDRWSETITVGQAYVAMLEFIQTYYRVGGEAEKEVEFMLGHISETPPDFIDPALEIEWFQAIDKVRG